MLSTTAKDFKEFADYLEAIKGDTASVVAVCSQDAADKAIAKRAGVFDKVIKVL